MKKHLVFLIVSLFFFCSILLLPANINAKTIKASSTETVETISSKDTYVDSNSPASNFGGTKILYVGGTSVHLHEAYFTFGLGDKPTDYIKAEICIYIFRIKQTTNIDIHIITASWEELTLNWNNKPAKSTKVTTMQLTSDGWHYIDISNFITEGLTSISICISVQTITDDYVFMGAREADGGIIEDYAYFQIYPKLIWSYEGEEDNGDSDGDSTASKIVTGVFDLALTMIIIFMVIGVVIILATFFFIIPFFRQREQSQRQYQQSNIVIKMPETQQPSPPPILTKYCSKCGAKIPQTASFCTYCSEPQF